jgi:hypothetical protein
MVDTWIYSSKRGGVYVDDCDDVDAEDAELTLVADVCWVKVDGKNDEAATDLRGHLLSAAPEFADVADAIDKALTMAGVEVLEGSNNPLEDIRFRAVAALKKAGLR